MFRGDIEGLRGVAVLLVIIYHFNYNICSGGYIGVDIFFVISGYLITGIIVRDIEKNMFSYNAFYNNRCKRIIPNSITVLCFVIFSLSFNNDYLYRLKVYKDCLYAILFNANTNYYFQSLDYYKSYEKQTPIIHYWSLSLEEQFYFIYPFIIYNLYRCNVIFLIIILLIYSLFICIKYSTTNRSFSFFIIICRAWQLLCGGLFNLLTNKLYSFNSYLSLLTLLLLSMVYNNRINYPGFYSILPTVISSFLLKDDNSKNKVLNTNVIRKIGEISYSLYLVHYPLLLIYINHKTYVKYFFLFIVSYILHIVIENPFHYSKSFYLFIRPISLTICLIIIMILLVLHLINSTERDKNNASQKKIYNYNSLREEINIFKKHECSFCCNNEYSNVVFSRYIFFLGDSHCFQLAASISDYAKQYGWKILHWWITRNGIVNNNMKLYQDLLGTVKYNLIITTYLYWLSKDDKEKFKENFVANLQFISRIGEYVIVVDDNPYFLESPIKTLVMYNREYEYVNRNCIVHAPFIIPSIKNIVHINFSKYYYDGNKCLLIHNNTVMYMDNSHLTINFVKIIGKELFNTIVNLPNFKKSQKVSNKSHDCVYFLPYKNDHYSHCSKYKACVIEN